MARTGIQYAMVIFAILSTAPSPVDPPQTRRQVQAIQRCLNEMFRNLSSTNKMESSQQKSYPGSYWFDRDGHWYEVRYTSDKSRDKPITLFIVDSTSPAGRDIEFAVTATTGKLDSVWMKGKWHAWQPRSGTPSIPPDERHRLVMEYHHVINVVLQHLQQVGDE